MKIPGQTVQWWDNRELVKMTEIMDKILRHKTWMLMIASKFCTPGYHKDMRPLLQVPFPVTDCPEILGRISVMVFLLFKTLFAQSFQRFIKRCFRFNQERWTFGKKCNFEHKCIKCNGPHPATKCRNYSGRNAGWIVRIRGVAYSNTCKKFSH